MEGRKRPITGHIIDTVEPGSIAEELEITPGDILLKINNQVVKDVFDYHYLVNDEYLTVLIQKPNNEEWELEIEKDYEEDLGIGFQEGLMDDYRSCCNKCIFCFIDQNPEDMRETIYFKDDDARLSFLQGNYITLTNMKDDDIERIIQYKLEPVNISVHTTNPELRCKMLNNRFAGDALKNLKVLHDNDISMNSQIVLCKNWNDKEELDRSIRELSELYPPMQSLSVVPLGKTKYREGVTELESFTKEDAAKVLDQIHGWQDKFLKKFGTRFVFASDEWYIRAGYSLPDASYYEGYGQIENGVGMMRSFLEEAEGYLEELNITPKPHKVSVVTGVLAYGIMEKLVEKIHQQFPQVEVHLYCIENHFYGPEITVTGLLTGQDIINQLKDKPLGDYLMLPNVLLRSGEEVLLDDITVNDIQNALQTPIRIVQSDGKSFVDAIITNK